MQCNCVSVQRARIATSVYGYGVKLESIKSTIRGCCRGIAVIGRLWIVIDLW